ncbi:hypothetical protein [Promicromonospora sukumoe]|uniref:hypothetical protein n=1 Tax=Promicromonospora sukumoe TaxID=88382 RepID=UPI00364A26A8
MNDATNVVVQIIRVSWTKESRGGPGAQARNAVAEGMQLPATWTPGSFHQVTHAEVDGYQPRSTCMPLARLDDRIQTVVSEEALWVQVHPLCLGLAYRGFHPRVRVRPGRTVRWLQNARWSTATGHGDRHYEAEAVNIAHWPAEHEVFDGPPDKIVDERMHLR